MGVWLAGKDIAQECFQQVSFKGRDVHAGRCLCDLQQTLEAPPHSPTLFLPDSRSTQVNCEQPSGAQPTSLSLASPSANTASFSITSANVPCPGHSPTFSTNSCTLRRANPESTPGAVASQNPSIPTNSTSLRYVVRENDIQKIPRRPITFLPAPPRYFHVTIRPPRHPAGGEWSSSGCPPDSPPALTPPAGLHLPETR